MKAVRSFEFRSPMTWVVAFAAFVFLLLGLRTLLFPASAAAFYGIPATAPEALAFVKAYGARNIAISLLAMTLLVLDVRKGIVALLGFAALIAALDAWIVASHAGMGTAAKHFVYVIVLSGLALATAWTGRRGLPKQPATAVTG